MHPALRSWREDVPAALVRGLAVFCGISVVSFALARYFQPPSITAINHSPQKVEWVEIDRPHAAFALSIPEAADVPFTYAIRRHPGGNGRVDMLSLGDADSAAPYLRVEVYRPGSETMQFAAFADEITNRANELAPADVAMSEEAVETKFGPLAVATFRAGKGAPRRCLGFIRTYDDPRLQIFGWFCQGGDLIERTTLACALDRFTLLSAGSEPKVGALFAQAELKRSFCGQRSPLLAPTPKHKALWGKIADNGRGTVRQ